MEPKDTRIQNLLFLLSAAPLSVGCVIVTDDTDTDAASTGPNTSGATDNATSAATENATSGATDNATGATSDPTGATTDPTGSADDTSDTTGAEFPPICGTYANALAGCYDMDPVYYDSALAYCVNDFELYADAGEACLAAIEGFYECLSELNCDVLTGEDPVCEAEFTAFETECAAE